MIEIGVIVYGIYTLITGKFTLLGGKKLEGWRGRVIGGILLSYLVLAFFGGMVLALTGNENILNDRMSLLGFTLVLLVLTIIAAFTVGHLLHNGQEAERIAHEMRSRPRQNGNLAGRPSVNDLQNNQDIEEDSSAGNISGTWKTIMGAVCVTVFIVFYITFKALVPIALSFRDAEVAKQKQARSAARKTTVKANSIGEALSLLQQVKSAGPWRNSLELYEPKDYKKLTIAWNFLKDNHDPDAAAEVGQALVDFPASVTLPNEALAAIERWATEEMVSLALDRIKNERIVSASKLLELFVEKMHSKKAAQYLASDLLNRDSEKLLEGFGPEGAAFVLPLLNSEHAGKNYVAHRLLKTWSVDNASLIQQSIGDLASENDKVIEASTKFIRANTNPSQLSDETKGELATALEAVIVNPSINYKRDTLKLLKDVSRDPETPLALLSALKNAAKKPSRVREKARNIVELLMEFDSEPALDGLIYAWHKDVDRKGIYRWFKENDSPMLVQKTADMWPAVDPQDLWRYLSLIFLNKEAMPLVFSHCCHDLESSDPELVKKGIEWLATFGRLQQKVRTRVYEAHHEQVSKALLQTLDKVDDLDEPLGKSVIFMAGLWGNPEVSKKLLRLSEESLSFKDEKLAAVKSLESHFLTRQALPEGKKWNSFRKKRSSFGKKRSSLKSN